MTEYTKFSHSEPRKIFKNFGSLRYCSKPIKTKIKINLYHHKNPENYGKKSNLFLWLTIDLLIFVSTLLNILAGTYLRRETSRAPGRSIPIC